MTPNAYSPNPWLVNLRPVTDPSLRLFCLPHAGGGVPAFRSWLKHLPPGIELWAVQLPGRGARLKESPYSRVENLVQDLMPAMTPFLDRNYAIFGHSLGAVVGFELARRFQREALSLPRRLFVAACRAPQVEAAEKPLHGLSDEVIQAELRKLNGTPDEVFEHSDLLRLVMPAIRGDLEAYETYTYQAGEALPSGITAFAGDHDGRFQLHEVQAWEQVAGGDFSFHVVKGDHFFIQNAEDDFFRIFLEEIEKITNPL